MPRSRITTQFAFEDHNASVLQRVNRGVSDFSKFVFSPAGAIAGAGALAAGIAKITSNYLQNADALQKMSLRTGLGTQELGALTYAFEQADLSADDLQRTVSRLNDRGLTLDDFADRIANIDDISQRTSLAVDVLGDRLGPRLLSVLDQGSEGLDRYRREHERLGLAIDQQSAEAAARFNDNIDTIQRVVEGAGNRVGSAIVNWAGPILDGLGKSVGILPDETRETMEQVERQLLSRVSQARAAGQSYAEALTDPITRELADRAIEIDSFARSYERILARASAREQYNAFVGPSADQTDDYLEAFNPGRRAFLARQDRLQDRLAEARRIRNLGEGAGNPYLPTPFGPQFTVGNPASLIGPGTGSLPGFAQRDPRSGALISAQAALDADPFNAFLNKETATIQAEAIRANQIIFDSGGEGGLGGFGGGGRIDGQGLIDASKNDPVRVTVAGVGGLNEGAGRNQRFREIRVDENDLINREGLINLVLAVLEDYVG